MCTLEQRGSLFVLSLTGDGEHRLSLDLIDSIRSALSQVKSQATRGSALVTTAGTGKFFSNGFDIAWAQAAGSTAAAMDRLSQMVNAFRPVVADLLSLPLPTVAAVTGHAAAAGLLFALCHDYLLMRRDRGVMYMSELDLGLPLPDYFTAALAAKIGSPAALRDVVLRASKLKADDGLRHGMVYSAHDSAEGTVEAAVRLGEQLAARKWDGKAYAELRKSLYPKLCGVVGSTEAALVSRL